MNGSSRPFQGPITSRCDRAATASITARPAASSETISRRAHEQRWPVVMKADCTTRAATASASPASQTTSGLLPPSSRARITSGRSAKWRRKKAPAAAEPVNSRPSISWSIKAWPTSRPPCTRLTTPGGTPAASSASTSNWPARGVSSDGLNTTVSPASRAGTMWPLGRWPGKLNGPSTAITPCGRWRSTARPKAMSLACSPVRSS